MERDSVRPASPTRSRCEWESARLTCFQWQELYCVHPARPQDSQNGTNLLFYRNVNQYLDYVKRAPYVASGPSRKTDSLTCVRIGKEGYGPASAAIFPMVTGVT